MFISIHLYEYLGRLKKKVTYSTIVILFGEFRNVGSNFQNVPSFYLRKHFC